MKRDNWVFTDWNELVASYSFLLKNLAKLCFQGESLYSCFDVFRHITFLDCFFNNGFRTDKLNFSFTTYHNSLISIIEEKGQKNEYSSSLLFELFNEISLFLNLRVQLWSIHITTKGIDLSLIRRQRHDQSGLLRIMLTKFSKCKELLLDTVCITNSSIGSHSSKQVINYHYSQVII